MADRGGGRISSQDWEQIFQDFRGSHESRNRWLSLHSPTGLLDQAIQAATSRKDFQLRMQILAFLDENAALLLAGSDDQQPSGTAILMDALRSTVQAAGDSGLPGGFKEQMMVTVTSAMICSGALESSPASLEALVEFLLNSINRPNHSADRHLRATACECLRELEVAHPCLLHLSAGHLLGLCQAERTHASQSYVLLLTTVLRNLASSIHRIRVFYASNGSYYSILSTTVPLVPFSIPAFFATEVPSTDSGFTQDNMRECRRAVSFLLERPNLLSESALSEFISDLADIASRLELQPSLLKLQFWNLLHVYSPISCHALLSIFTRFPEAFEGEEVAIYKRLVLFCREYAQALPVKLLALHWLLGMEKIIVSRGKRSILPQVGNGLYPQVFDPLSLKAAKLECLAQYAAVQDKLPEAEEEVSASRLFNDALVCLSSYEWLPVQSTETRLLFHVLHRFLVARIPQTKQVDADEYFTESLLFKSLQETLVTMTKKVRKLVCRILALVDRFLSCQAHHSLGRRLLRTFSEGLVPELPENLQLPAYFCLMERIAEDPMIPPTALIETLDAYVKRRVSAGRGDEDARLWLRGSEVLNICRTLLLHHQSSRIFHKLAGLLGYMCRAFPDIEVRGSARFYLRVLVSVPGKKLRQILKYGDDRMEDSKPELLHVSSILRSLQSPRMSNGVKDVEHQLSQIVLERLVPLLVQSSWSLVVHESFVPITEEVPEDKPPNEEADNTALNNEDGKDKLPGPEQNVARMMDAQTAEVLNVLRRHFSGIPDSGLKVQIACRLRLFLEQQEEKPDPSEVQGIYAVVLNFSTSGSYGPIPAVRVPFLLASPAPSLSDSGKQIVPSSDGPETDDRFCKTINIELEPKQPAPALVDCHIVFSDEDAQTVEGQLESIPVGIEDLFMRPPLLSDAPEGYLCDLFNALWYGCGGPGKLGTEIFLLKDGDQGVGIQGSESVKLLEDPADAVLAAVDKYLAEFVVSVSGPALLSMSRGTGRFPNARWTEEDEQGVKQEYPEPQSEKEQESEAEQLEYSHELVEVDVAEEGEEPENGEVGSLWVLIFLPPRYHLLLKMEVSDWSTLVRIRTDYWPGLAHIDEFLECFMRPSE